MKKVVYFQMFLVRNEFKVSVLLFGTRLKPSGSKSVIACSSLEILCKYSMSFCWILEVINSADDE